MTAMAHNGAAMVRIRQQRLSKRAQKFRRLLRLRANRDIASAVQAPRATLPGVRERGLTV
jgi:hypothetical protein